MRLTPTVHDVLYDEFCAPYILAEMKREEKLKVLIMMNRTHPLLVRKYVNKLFSSGWDWKRQNTGICQERASMSGWGKGGLELHDVVNDKFYGNK